MMDVPEVASPRLRASWAILSEVATDASAALEDVCRLYQPDPHENPAVRAGQSACSGGLSRLTNLARSPLPRSGG